MNKATTMKNILATLLITLSLPMSMASVASSNIKLDHAPVNLNNQESLQRGARIFTNYCLTCHAAGSARYNRMADFGLTDAQIKENLLFAAEKVGSPMTVAMRQDDAKAWFGATPPDLSVISRSRGADWLYSYLRGFYRDNSRPTGWNNTVFNKVGMPHALFELQGEIVPVMHEHHTADGKVEQVVDHLKLAKPGRMTQAEYDAAVGDLVNYLVWMGEPAQNTRHLIGFYVLLFLGLFLPFVYYLKKAYWKDIH